MQYGEVVERGREAGKTMPPQGVLIQWITQKMGVSAETAAEIEFPIRRKIGQKGFEGVHMFEEAFKDGSNTVTKIFEKAGFKIAMNLNS